MRVGRIVVVAGCDCVGQLQLFAVGQEVEGLSVAVECPRHCARSLGARKPGRNRQHACRVNRRAVIGDQAAACDRKGHNIRHVNIRQRQRARGTQRRVGLGISTCRTVCAARRVNHRAVVGAFKCQDNVAYCGDRAVRDRHLIFLSKFFTNGQIIQHGIVQVEGVEYRAGICLRGACRCEEAGRESADIVGQKCAASLNRCAADRQCRDVIRIDVVKCYRTVYCRAGHVLGEDICIGVFYYCGREVFAFQNIGCVVCAVDPDCAGEVNHIGRAVRGCGCHLIPDHNINELACIQRVEHCCIAVKGHRTRCTGGARQIKRVGDIGSVEAGRNGSVNRCAT